MTSLARAYFSENASYSCDTNLPPLLPADTRISVQHIVIRIAKKKIVRAGELWMSSQVNKGIFSDGMRFHEKPIFSF